MNGKPLPIYGDGKQQRDWLHVEDNCRGILAVLEHGRVGQTYNIGGSQVEENLCMAKRLLQAMSCADSLLTYVQDRPGHDRRYALDCCKIQQELGWRPSIPLDQGLRQTIAWYAANSDWLACIRTGAYRHYYETYYERRDSTLAALGHHFDRAASQGAPNLP